MELDPLNAALPANRAMALLKLQRFVPINRQRTYVRRLFARMCVRVCMYVYQGMCMCGYIYTGNKQLLFSSPSNPVIHVHHSAEKFLFQIHVDFPLIRTYASVC